MMIVFPWKGKKFMQDKVFIDSNIWLYALVQRPREQEKNLKAKACIVDASDILVSTQVVNEVCINPAFDFKFITN